MKNPDFEPSSYRHLYEERPQGKLIILNGTSSCGKGTISKELQQLLDEPFMHLSIDTFFHMLPEKTLNSEKGKAFGPEIIRILKGFYNSAAHLVEAGNHVIIDTVLQDGIYDLRNLLPPLKHLNPLFVGVKCDLAELERREKERGDRHIGLAKFQYPRVHSHEIYDLEVDSGISSPEECARVIQNQLISRDKSSVVEELYNNYCVTP